MTGLGLTGLSHAGMLRLAGLSHAGLSHSGMLRLTCLLRIAGLLRMARLGRTLRLTRLLRIAGLLRMARLSRTLRLTRMLGLTGCRRSIGIVGVHDYLLAGLEHRAERLAEAAGIMRLAPDRAPTLELAHQTLTTEDR